ncbi:MAG TPA: transporter substrate-binding domain-containing protein [Bacteroidales bacterium]|nr:transporter substrate-binding domain-containing protein [Bacteroidales bacterium]
MIKRLITFFSFLVIVSFSCSDNNKLPDLTGSRLLNADLKEIRQRGRLIAVTDFNSTNYFIYKGEPMGFNYELLKTFSDQAGIDLEIVTENHIEHAIDMLNSGKADLIAMSITVNGTRKKDIQFTESLDETRQMLVQRKPRNWRSMTAAAVDKSVLRNQLDLAGKTVYVQEGSTHAERLRTLAHEIGDSITVVEVPYESEELIKNVARGDIEYTVTDENIARVNATYYPDIDINTPVSFPQKLAWGVRKQNSEQLLAELNRWISTFRKTEDYAILYSKYFRNSRSGTMIRSDYYALSTGKVSKYDEIIRQFSDTINWDWRLLASLICQESRFDAEVTSWAGAYGLMQVMPLTGERFGIDVTSSPKNNIRAGVMYINWLHTIFDPKIADEKERLNFILASYNAGPGHVLDAMRLAGKNGKDPEKWADVEVWLQKKSDPKYYNDEVVKNGYFTGRESVAFVSQILDRYEHYRNILPEGPDSQEK